MAHTTSISAAPAEESEPEMHVSLPKGMAMTGMEMGKKCRVTLEGEVCGMSMGEYGGSVTLKGRKATVEHLGEMAGDLEKHRARARRKEA